jgi:hypothetical protein
LTEQIDEIKNSLDSPAKQLQAFAELIDQQIITGYKLWPTKYIAYDLMHGGNEYADHYTEEEKTYFETRFHKGVDQNDPVAVRNFLAMYANPVVNQKKLIAEY